MQITNKMHQIENEKETVTFRLPVNKDYNLSRSKLTMDLVFTHIPRGIIGISITPLIERIYLKDSNRILMDIGKRHLSRSHDSIARKTTETTYEIDLKYLVPNSILGSDQDICFRDELDLVFIFTKTEELSKILSVGLHLAIPIKKEE